MLHTISCSLSHLDTRSLLGMITSEDVVLLMQDGVVNGIENSQYWQQLSPCGAKVYALQSDLLARGLEPYLAQSITAIDFEQFVNLTVMHRPQMAWPS